MISVILSEFDFGQSLAQASAGVEHLGAGLEVVPVRQAENRAAALNAAVEAARGEILLFLPSFVEPLPGLVDEVLAGLAAEPAAGIVYGDYTILVGPGNEARQTLLAHESDLSEWSGIGYVAGVRREVFRAAGGYDPAYRFAEEYDLRLRITRRARLVRTAEPLCRLDRASVPLEDERVKQSLRRWFTPESSPKKGYGYLFSAAGCGSGDRARLRRGAARARRVPRGRDQPGRLPARAEPAHRQRGDPRVQSGPVPRQGGRQRARRRVP